MNLHRILLSIITKIIEWFIPEPNSVGNKQKYNQPINQKFMESAGYQSYQIDKQTRMYIILVVG